MIGECYYVIVLIKLDYGISCLITVLSSVADNEEPSTSSARDTPPAKKVKVSPSVSSRPRSPPRARSPPRTPKTIRDKFSQAQPYSFFLTRVSGIADKFNSSFVMDIKGNITFVIDSHNFR